MSSLSPKMLQDTILDVGVKNHISYGCINYGFLISFVPLLAASISGPSQDTNTRGNAFVTLVL